jgi:NTE family protein
MPIALALCLGACASRVWNEALAPSAPGSPYTYKTTAPRNDDKTFVVLALSGGGMRSAAFAYGVLKKLRATAVRIDGRDRRLIDEVDVITAVSGGSYPAAYFGLFGDRLFDDFEERFLRRNVEGELIGTLANPLHLAALATPDFNRGDLAAQWLAANLFEHKTFADMSRDGRPYVIINATDLNNGTPFSFTQKYFDFLCSDIRGYPVANAVVASSAVPVVFGPISLRNYPDCPQRHRGWVEAALRTGDTTDRRYGIARAIARYADDSRMPVLRLVDGGVTDNLGVRASVLSPVAHDGDVADLAGAFGPQRLRTIRRVLVIVANAQTYPEYDWSRAAREPGAIDTLTSSFDAALGILNTETVSLARAGFLDWESRVNARRGPHAGKVKVYFAVLTFNAIKDAARRALLDSIPTSLALDRRQIDTAIAAGADLLDQSREYRAFLASLHDGEPRAGMAAARSRDEVAGE